MQGVQELEKYLKIIIRQNMFKNYHKTFWESGPRNIFKSMAHKLHSRHRPASLCVPLMQIKCENLNVKRLSVRKVPEQQIPEEDVEQSDR